MAMTWCSGAKWGSSLTWRGTAAAYRNKSAYRTPDLDYRGNLPTGGGTDEVFQLNSQTVTVSYVIPTGKSASSAGPITINSGVVVTVPSGSRWVIL